MCSLADLNIGHCVELAFFKGKLGKMFIKGESRTQFR